MAIADKERSTNFCFALHCTDPSCITVAATDLACYRVYSVVRHEILIEGYITAQLSLTHRTQSLLPYDSPAEFLLTSVYIKTILEFSLDIRIIPPCHSQSLPEEPMCRSLVLRNISTL